MKLTTGYKKPIDSSGLILMSDGSHKNIALIINDYGAMTISPFITFSNPINADILGNATTADRLKNDRSGSAVGGWGECKIEGGVIKYYNSTYSSLPANGGNADTVDNLHAHTGRNNEANKLVRTDASGYIQAGWINTTSGGFNGTPASTIDRIYCSEDTYLRYLSPSNFISALKLVTTNTTLTISGSKTIDSLTVGNLTVTGASTLTGDTNAGTITATSFKKSGSSDSYVLLAGGGVKALSTFNGSPKTLTFSTSGSGDTDSYNTSTAKTISYNSVIPILGCKFLELNFFTIDSTGGGNSANLFTSTAGTTSLRLVPYFRFKDPEGTYITDWDKTSYTITGTNAAIVVESGAKWLQSGNYYYLNKSDLASASGSTANGGMICTLQSGATKTSRKDYAAVINITYGGATKKFTIYGSFWRPLYVFNYSGDSVDATVLDSLASKTSASSITIGSETCNMNLYSYKYTGNIGLNINSSVALYVYVLAPYNGSSTSSVGSAEISCGGIKNSLLLSCFLDKGYIYNNTYGCYRVYSTDGKQAKSASPTVYLI